MTWLDDRLYALNSGLQASLLSKPYKEFWRTISHTFFKDDIYNLLVTW